MKYILLPAFVALWLTSCSPSGKSSSESIDYTLAYNIHIPDTTKDDWEIMHMNFDGSGKKNIINHSDVAWTYYAFKDRLFFISDRDTAYRHFFLYECDADGNNIRKISDLRLEDSWMSSRNEGKEMVVAGRPDRLTRFQLFLINTDDGTYRQLTNDTAAMYRDPCFSPDGQQIVFSYRKNKRDRTVPEELYLMNADGTNLHQLTQYPMDNVSAQDYGYKAGSAKWHPTENFISYVSKQDGKNSIFAITPDGSRQWKLIDNPESEGWHDWSSNGKWLAYNGSDAEETRYHIYLMNWETKEVKQLTDTTYKSQLAPVFLEKRK
jgi:TolB protein